jgi:hypothetical protein
MNTKKFYITPAMEAVKIDSVTLLAGSNELNTSVGFIGRGTIVDDYED